MPIRFFHWLAYQTACVKSEPDDSGASLRNLQDTMRSSTVTSQSVCCHSNSSSYGAVTVPESGSYLSLPVDCSEVDDRAPNSPLPAVVIIIIMYIYHALINALSAHMIHINLNMIFYTNVKHSPTKTIYIKYY